MSNSTLPSSRPKSTVSIPNKIDLLALLDKIPPEAVLSIVDLAADVVRANKVMEGRDQDFQHTIAKLRETNLDRRERLALLVGLLKELDLNEEAQMRLVEGICRIAEGG